MNLPCLVTTPVVSYTCFAPEPLVATASTWSLTVDDQEQDMQKQWSAMEYNQLHDRAHYCSSRLSHGRPIRETELEHRQYQQQPSACKKTGNTRSTSNVRHRSHRHRSRKKPPDTHDREEIDGYLAKIQQCMRSQTLRSRQLAMSQVNRLLGKFKQRPRKQRQQMRQMKSRSFSSTELKLNIKDRSQTKKRRPLHSHVHQHHRMQQRHNLSTSSSLSSIKSSISQFAFDSIADESQQLQKQPRHLAKLLLKPLKQTNTNQNKSTVQKEDVFITKEWLVENEQLVGVPPGMGAFPLAAPLPSASARLLLQQSQFIDWEIPEQSQETDPEEYVVESRVLSHVPVKAGDQKYEMRRRASLHSPSQREVQGWVTDTPELWTMFN